MLLLVQLGPWQAQFWGKTVLQHRDRAMGLSTQGQCFSGWFLSGLSTQRQCFSGWFLSGLSTQGQYFSGWTSLLWCAKATQFWTVKQHKAQPRSDSLTGPVKIFYFNNKLIFWSTAAGQVSLCARFIHSAQCQTDKEKSRVILVGRVQHCYYSHGPWRIFQHNLTGLVLCLIPTQVIKSFQPCWSQQWQQEQ